MSTKTPAAVQLSSEKSLDKIAYAAVEAVATREPNDNNRLGYHIWRWLVDRNGTLENAVSESGARLEIPSHEAAKIIHESLVKQNIALPR